MAVPNRESYPTPPLAEKVIDRDNPYKQPDWVKEGWPDEMTQVVEQLYKDFNGSHGSVAPTS